MFGMPNIAEVDGTIPPSSPHRDFAPEVSTSSCDRRVRATETENSFRLQSEPTRPLHEFPHGSIKQRTFAVATVRDFLGVQHAEHREIESESDREVNAARCESANDQSDAHLRRSAAWQCR
jgi:hypothetical protein